MSYSVRWTGRLLNPLARDLRNLAGLGYPQYRPLVWAEDSGVFFPPGLWYEMDPGPGRPWFWHLPPPHHPLEAVAARRGWGGVEGQNEQPDWKRARTGSWFDHTATLGRHLIMTPAEVRLLWHVLTPMRTNGGMPDNWVDNAEAWRKRLYKAGGLPRAEHYAKWAWVEASEWRSASTPTRMQFWGEEVTGEVEL